MDSLQKPGAAAWEDADFQKQLEAITDQTQHKYVALGRQAFKEMIGTGNEKQGWKFSQKKKEVNIWKKRSTSGAQCIKAEGQIPFPADQILEFLYDQEEQMKYDKDMADGKYLIDFPLDVKLGYSAFKGRFMISGRDFLYIASHAKSPDGTIVLAFKSVEHPEYPPVKKYVRAHTYIAGWFIKPKEDDHNKCDCLYMSEVTLKGSLPQTLQDVAANNQGHKVFKVREAMLKKYGDK